MGSSQPGDRNKCKVYHLKVDIRRFVKLAEHCTSKVTHVKDVACHVHCTSCVAGRCDRQNPTWKAEPPEPKVLLFLVPLVCPVASVMAPLLVL